MRRGSDARPIGRRGVLKVLKVLTGLTVLVLKVLTGLTVLVLKVLGCAP